MSLFLGQPGRNPDRLGSLPTQFSSFGSLTLTRSRPHPTPYYRSSEPRQLLRGVRWATGRAKAHPWRSCSVFILAVMQSGVRQNNDPPCLLVASITIYRRLLHSGQKPCVSASAANARRSRAGNLVLG